MFLMETYIFAGFNKNKFNLKDSREYQLLWMTNFKNEVSASTNFEFALYFLVYFPLRMKKKDFTSPRF